MEELIGNQIGNSGARKRLFEGRDGVTPGRSDEKPAATERQFEDAFERAPNGMVLADLGGRLLRSNEALCEIVGYTERELRTMILRDLACPDDRENDSDLSRQLLDGDIHAYRAEKRYLHGEGRLVWVSLDVAVVRGLDGNNPPYFVVQIRDITRRKAFEEELIHRASRDPLTGLANRALFGENLERALAYARRHGKTIVVFFVDLDNFKLINDGLGHRSGDLLLIEVADRLKALLRTEDTIARLGGDEFAVLLQDDANVDDLTELAERILQRLREPCVLGDTEVRITASIGIALDISREDRPEGMLQKADDALYRAKGNGKTATRRSSWKPRGEPRARSPKHRRHGRGVSGEAGKLSQRTDRG